MSSDDKFAEATSKSSNETLHEMPSIEWMVLHHLFIIVFTLFGNILLIFVIFKNNQIVRRKRVTPVQILMLHMCAADILFAVITMIPTMIMTITVPFFFGPNFLCKLTKLLQVFPMYASSFLLVAISADRYQAICRPLASMRSAYNRPSMYAVLAWSAAFIFSTPQLSLFRKKNGDCMGAYTSPIQYTIYVIVFNVLVWLLPSAIAGFLYYQVCKAVWQSTSFTSNLRSETPQRSSSTEERSLELSPSQQLYSQQKGGILQCLELDRRRVQTVKLTLTIVAANFLLWTPFCLISIIDAVWPDAISMLSISKFKNVSFSDPTFATYIMFFGNLNSCMNPWIWFYFNQPQMRRALSCYFGSKPTMSLRRVLDANTECTYDTQNYSESKINTSGSWTTQQQI